MALNYLKYGLNSLATPGSWELADGTAGTGVVAGATLVIERGSQVIDQDVDYNTISIVSFDTLQGFGGELGSSTNPFRVRVDSGSEDLTGVVARMRYWASGGACWFYPDTACDILQVGDGIGQPSMRIVNGTVKHFQLASGSAYFSESWTATALGIWELEGGECVVTRHASNALVTVHANKGKHAIRRAVTTLNVRGASVELDLRDLTATTINLDAGEIKLLSHNATGGQLNARGGVLDLTKVTRPITFANAILGAVEIKGFNKLYHTFTTPQYVGPGPKGGPIPV